MIPIISKVVFGTEVFEISKDRARVELLLKSTVSDERAGAVALLATQFDIPKDRLRSLLKNFLSSERSDDCIAHAGRYLDALDAPQLDGRTLNDCVEQFRRGSTDAKVEALSYIGSFLNVSDPIVDDICDVAKQDPEIQVRMAAMSSIITKRFTKTEDSRIAREYATIALDPTNDDQLRTVAARVVCWIYFPDREKNESSEYDRKDKLMFDQFVRLIKEKVAGIDYDFLNWVIEDAAAREN